MIPVLLELSKLVLTAAPTIASALFSPACGMVISLLESAFPASAGQGGILDAIKSHDDPEKVLTDLETKYAPILKPVINSNPLSRLKIELTLEFDKPSGDTQ